MKYCTILMLLFSVTLSAAEKVIFESKTIKDWGGAVRKTTCKDGLFDTNKDLFVASHSEDAWMKPLSAYRQGIRMFLHIEGVGVF